MWVVYVYREKRASEESTKNKSHTHRDAFFAFSTFILFIYIYLLYIVLKEKGLASHPQKREQKDAGRHSIKRGRRGGVVAVSNEIKKLFNEISRGGWGRQRGQCMRVNILHSRVFPTPPEGSEVIYL